MAAREKNLAADQSQVGSSVKISAYFKHLMRKLSFPRNK